ncbi:hypothetical protein BLNAU_953 [Blattamonas nauphoetae]|uniref:Uncharacterized protein n=1 Tax=Blattamonas nauphoetae TaxID=2049346 RepID=A0ABQ9YJQ6_9EUKA|nr:hypothetical protein BLNAU_953 [Blattamonas nauphoetae]
MEIVVPGPALLNHENLSHIITRILREMEVQLNTLPYFVDNISTVVGSVGDGFNVWDQKQFGAPFLCVLTSHMVECEPVTIFRLIGSASRSNLRIATMPIGLIRNSCNSIHIIHEAISATQLITKQTARRLLTHLFFFRAFSLFCRNRYQPDKSTGSTDQIEDILNREQPKPAQLPPDEDDENNGFFSLLGDAPPRNEGWTEEIKNSEVIPTMLSCLVETSSSLALSCHGIFHENPDTDDSVQNEDGRWFVPRIRTHEESMWVNPTISRVEEITHQLAAEMAITEDVWSRLDKDTLPLSLEWCTLATNALQAAVSGFENTVFNNCGTDEMRLFVADELRNTRGAPEGRSRTWKLSISPLHMSSALIAVSSQLLYLHLHLPPTLASLAHMALFGSLATLNTIHLAIDVSLPEVPLALPSEPEWEETGITRMTEADFEAARIRQAQLALEHHNDQTEAGIDVEAFEGAGLGLWDEAGRPYDLSAIDPATIVPLPDPISEPLLNDYGTASANADPFFELDSDNDDLSPPTSPGDTDKLSEDLFNPTNSTASIPTLFELLPLLIPHRHSLFTALCTTCLGLFGNSGDYVHLDFVVLTLNLLRESKEVWESVLSTDAIPAIFRQLASPRRETEEARHTTAVERALLRLSLQMLVSRERRQDGTIISLVAPPPSPTLSLTMAVVCIAGQSAGQLEEEEGPVQSMEIDNVAIAEERLMVELVGKGIIRRKDAMLLLRLMDARDAVLH